MHGDGVDVIDREALAVEHHPHVRFTLADHAVNLAGHAPVEALLTRLAVGLLVVIELEVRLRVQRDEEAECEVAVRRAVEGEDRPPVVQLSLQ